MPTRNLLNRQAVISVTSGGLIATPKYRQGAYEEKQILYRNLVLISLLPLVEDVCGGSRELSFTVYMYCTAGKGWMLAFW
jgi:hypothetical protein